MTATIRISRFTGEKDNAPRGVDLSWDQLCEALGSKGVKASPCTIDTCGAGENIYDGKPGQCVHKYVGAWSPAVYRPGETRSKKNVGSVSLLVLDLDHLTDVQLESELGGLEDYQYVAHGSHSDQRRLNCRRHQKVNCDKRGCRAGVERSVRVAIALSRPVLGTDWPRFWEAAVQMLGVINIDESACDSSRLYFTSTRRSDAEFYFATNEGKPLDVDEVLAKAKPAAPAIANGAPSEFGPASAALLAEAARHMANMPPAVEGDNGDTRTYAICCELMNGYKLTDEQAWPLLAAWNQRCTPPWSEDGLREKLANARSYAAGAPGATRLEFEATEAIREMFGTVEESAPQKKPEPIEVPAEKDVLAILGSISETITPQAAPGSWAHELELAERDVRATMSGASDVGEVEPLFQSATELLRRKFPPTIWLASGLVLRGGTAIIGGEPKTTKSWLALETCVAVATGTPVAGEFATSAPELAVYFFAEDVGQSIQSRIRALAIGRGMDPAKAAENLHVQPRGRFLDLTRDKDVALVVASCRKIERERGRKLAVLVLDPLRDLHSGEEDKSDDMGPVMRRIRVIGELLGGITVLVVHHMGKPSDGKGKRRGGNRLRGSGAIFGAIDTGIYLDGPQGDGRSVFTNGVETDVKSARSAGSFKLTLTVEDGPDGTATRATWHAAVPSKRAPGSAPKKTQDELDEDAVLSFLRKLHAGGSAPPSSTNLRGVVPDPSRKGETVPDRRMKAALGRLATRTTPAVRAGEGWDPVTKRLLKGDRYYLVEEVRDPEPTTLDKIIRGES